MTTCFPNSFLPSALIAGLGRMVVNRWYRNVLLARTARPLKSRAIVLAMAASLLLTTGANSQVTLTDIGATDPTPGSNDISQFSTGGNLATPPGLNYYWDNGANNPTSSGYIG